MVSRLDLEQITITKLREWTKRCKLPSITSAQYPDHKEYYVGVRAGPGITLVFNTETSITRSWDLTLKDGIKNKTRCEDVELLYADPRFFEKIERFIKHVIRTRIDTAKQIADKIESTPIFDKETVS